MIRRYHEFADQIARIAAKTPKGFRIPGSALLAQKFGVNQRTVMKAIRLLAEKNIVVIRGTSGVYPVKETAVRRKKTGIIAIVGVRANTELADFIQQRLNGSGFHPVFLDFEPSVFEENPSFVLNFDADGFLFRFSINFNLKIERYLVDLGVPYVLLNRPMGAKMVDSSVNDHKEGWCVLLEYLKEQGCRRIAYVERLKSPRYENYAKWVRKFFMPELAECSLEGCCIFFDNTQELSEISNSIRRTLSGKADTLVTGDGYFARFLLRNFQEKGLFRVGASWDNNEQPPSDLLCVYHDHHDRIGWALDRLLLRISGSPIPFENHVSVFSLQIPEFYHNKHNRKGKMLFTSGILTNETFLQNVKTQQPHRKEQTMFSHSSLIFHH